MSPQGDASGRWHYAPPVMSSTARKDLHALVDALPASEEQAARRYLEYLRDASDPYASLDRVDPFVDMPDDERARLHASLQRAEEEIASGDSTSAEDLVRELRAAR
jgi:hypothetical protein